MIATAVWKVSSLRYLCTSMLLQGINTQCQQLSSKTIGTKIHLHSTGVESLVNFDWKAMIQELATVAPDLVDIVVTVAVSRETKRVNKVK